jgi:hypothetical protein
MGEVRNAYKILAKKSERERLLGRTSDRWQYNIIMGFKKAEWEVVDWTNLAYDRIR